MRRGRVNLTVLIGGLALVIPFLVLMAVSFGRNPRAVPQALLDQPAPAFTLQTLEGETVSLDAFRGKKMVINFWSTWCGPCKIEHPVLTAAPRQYPDTVFLGVIYSDEPENAQRYLARAGTSYPHLVDPGGRVAIDYGVAGVPETYFVDETGRIFHKQEGVVSPALLRSLLGGG